MSGMEGVMRVEEISGRGRSVISTEALKGGQVVLRESPILLYSALPIIKHQSTSNDYCDHCFRTLLPSEEEARGGVSSCPRCSYHLFCSPNCLSAALSSSHSPWVCQALCRLRASCTLPLDRQLQARFLIAAYNLAFVSSSHYQMLLSLQGRACDCDADDAKFLHSLLSSLCAGFSFSPELSASLLAKDKFNAFGLMEPFHKSGGHRSVRAYAIYPTASFFNHDCLPNACRFDYLDSASPDNNTDIIVRMIHDVPPGREICLSYFPVNYNYSDRQKRLLQDYGFTCDCDRCKVEANWSESDDDNDNDNDPNEEDTDRMDEDNHQGMTVPENEYGEVEVEEADSDFPHAYFFLRYMCTQHNCWGTLAPLPPSHAYAAPSDVLECNVCGSLNHP